MNIKNNYYTYIYFIMIYNIYVLSTSEKIKRNIYKIGKHKGSQNKLLARYKTALINPVIYFYQHVNNYTIIENKIKSRLNQYRIRDENNRITEWVTLELSQIIKCIIDIICEIPSSLENKLLNEPLNFHIYIIFFFICYKILSI